MDFSALLQLMPMATMVLPAFLPLLIKRPVGVNRYTPYMPSPLQFSDALWVCLKKSAIFYGRASRSEFWWFYLFYAGLNIGLTGIGALTNLSWLVYISYPFAIPLLSVGVRRLHDINRSGWWVLLSFGLGIIPLTFMWATASQPEETVSEVFD
ncbi:DUF805 domain-containing protein [Asticcacaulis sp. YBE204]|uniref:DUF805 domain-containing protein n=1 Tax=Asticcacaulis sp. YBE204 TaxID=1282363 RepID=UPI0003C3C157|nr:DUF805 domain-containing protein [Asticcacaulis sp. YBE204]ESQ80041.1 hypothetical protein AEYBE204_05330 [Asticcacaulis sp. YBE204]